MIIQCEQCQTKFRLDDAKIKGRGVKVRCSKCRHVFLVQRAEAMPETAFAELLEQCEVGTSSVQADTSGGPTPVETATVSGGVDEHVGSGLAPEWEMQGAQEESDISLPRPLEPSVDESLPPPPVQADDFDFAFDFADTDQSQEAVPSPAIPSVTHDSAEPVASDDFSIDFGELSFPQPALAGVTAGADAAQGGDDFNLGFDDLLDAESVQKDGLTKTIGIDDEIFATAASQPAQDDGDGFGKFDFSDLDLGELPSSVQAAQTAASVDGEGEPPTELPVPSPVPASQVPEPVVDEGAELPPLTISSRRRGASFFPAVVIAAAIIFVVILAGIGFFVVSGPETAKRMGLGFIATLIGGEVQDENKITLGKVSAEFVSNKEAGELFVIRGETINNYNKPRASIQVKATLLGANGQAIRNKPAYCGNSLTKEQLATLPLVKIEEVMNNQFGDSLSNLGVQPGKSIPFVVVFANVPKDAVDFSVAVAGSTVATK